MADLLYLPMYGQTPYMSTLLTAEDAAPARPAMSWSMIILERCAAGRLQHIIDAKDTDAAELENLCLEAMGR
ncbi:hypothetical protein [Sphingopyxis sp.]|uniref:hypothetical protein n=1 Tax=Sphingopyxis sp. TaxID=1908224 RepID=UPI0025D78CF6|nr:hypothetical protein [Sphingopyxis sp.]MBK6414124.1 hypothetical protein [Sphingopyxis sp.]